MVIMVDVLKDSKLLQRALGKLGKVNKEPYVYSYTGKPVKVDATITSRAQTYAVFTFNWKRPVGINKIHQIERLLKNAPLDGALLISKSFSENAVELSEKIRENTEQKIILMNTQELENLINY